MLPVVVLHLNLPWQGRLVNQVSTEKSWRFDNWVRVRYDIDEKGGGEMMFEAGRTKFDSEGDARR